MHVTRNNEVDRRIDVHVLHLISQDLRKNHAVLVRLGVAICAVERAMPGDDDPRPRSAVCIRRSKISAQPRLLVRVDVRRVDRRLRVRHRQMQGGADVERVKHGRVVGIVPARVHVANLV